MGQRTGGTAAVGQAINRDVTAKVTTRLATNAPLADNNYDNGFLGVGATITANVNGILPDIDGITPLVGDRVLVKNEAGLKNGFYIVTSVGGAGSEWRLTRSEDANENIEVGVNTNAFVSEGTVNHDTLFSLTTDGVINIGFTSLVFEAATGAAIPGGGDTQIQFNDSGVFAGDSNYIWNNTTKRLGLGVSPTARFHAQVPTSSGAAFIAKFESDGGNLSALAIRDNGLIELGKSGSGLITFNAGAAIALTMQNNVSGIIQTEIRSNGEIRLSNSSGVIHHNLNTGTHSYLVNSSMNLGIGITGPTAKLHTQVSTSAGANFIAKFEGGGGTVPALYVRDDGNVSIGTIPTFTRFTIRGSGNNNTTITANFENVNGSDIFTIKNGGDMLIAPIPSAGAISMGDPAVTNYRLTIRSIFNLATTLQLYRSLNTNGAGVIHAFAMNDANDTKTEVAYTVGTMVDNTAGSVKGAYAIWTRNGASITEKVRIDHAGNLGIGLTNITAKLHIQVNTSAGATFIAKFEGGGGSPALMVRDDGNVAIGTSTPNAESLLELESTTKAFRFTRMTTAQRTAMTGASGFIVLDTTLGFVFYHTGSAWVQL